MTTETEAGAIEGSREATPEAASSAEDRAARLRRFGAAIDAIRERVEARVGPEDVAYVRRVDGFSRAMEGIGRGLLHAGTGPLTFSLGVAALFVHKQLQAMEIGHTALHGTYDRLQGAERFHARGFRWDMPVDEESWARGHNIRHHQYTNIAGKDADLRFGPIRMSERTPHSRRHRFQVPIMLGILVPHFAFMMNIHYAGLSDVYYLVSDRDEDRDVIPDHSWASVKAAHQRAFRKWVPYYLETYLVYPLLAGRRYRRVLVGNWMVERLRDLYTGATVYCGHLGDDVPSYPEGTRAHGRDEWYAMQVESTANLEVSLPLSLLCGGLDRQIEHHLFPRLSPMRLREVAPEVRAACEAHGIAYRTSSWGSRLKKVVQRARALGVRDLVRAAL